MTEVYQPIFTRACTEELRSKLASGESLTDYFKTTIDVPEGSTIQSTLLVEGALPELDTEIESDVDNAIKLYEYFHNLDKTQASDKRLWIYLSHVTFREYTIGRWGIRTPEAELMASQDAQRRAINYIAEHWFLSGSSRSLRRHSIARLWWAAYLTVAPWEQDPDYFSSLDTSDRYIYTKILFSTQDIYQQTLERNLGRSNKLLIAILEYLRLNPGKREEVRTIMKELNLALGYRQLSVLSFDELLKVIADTAQSNAEVIN
jgi:hypothetical protein